MRIKRLHSAHGFNKSLLGNGKLEVEKTFVEQQFLGTRYYAHN